MSCCILIVLILFVVSILILSAIYILSKKINNNTQQTSSEIKIDDKNSEIYNEKIFNEVTFTCIDNKPAVYICSNKKCKYTSICNLQICKHLIDNVTISYDKQTNKNVTYIHIDNCIIVFITKNENLCMKEQEFSSEDINYIKSYTSKYIDTSVYKVQFDSSTRKFINFNGDEHEEYTILLNSNNIVREIDNDDDNSFINTNINIPPTAPSLNLGLQIKQRTDNKGGFFYIEK